MTTIKTVLPLLKEILLKTAITFWIIQNHLGWLQDKHQRVTWNHWHLQVFKWHLQVHFHLALAWHPMLLPWWIWDFQEIGVLKLYKKIWGIKPFQTLSDRKHSFRILGWMKIIYSLLMKILVNLFYFFQSWISHRLPFE